MEFRGRTLLYGSLKEHNAERQLRPFYMIANAARYLSKI